MCSLRVKFSLHSFAKWWKLHHTSLTSGTDGSKFRKTLLKATFLYFSDTLCMTFRQLSSGIGKLDEQIFED